MSKEDSTTNRVVVFYLKDERYAIDVSHVISIIVPPDNITPLPMAPEFVRGVINLRGRIVTVIDLRIRFGMDVEGNTGNRIIIVRSKSNSESEYWLGFIVDNVTEVIPVTDGDIKPIPDVIKVAVDNEYLAGLYQPEDGDLTIMVDSDKIVTAEELMSYSNKQE